MKVKIDLRTASSGYVSFGKIDIPTGESIQKILNIVSDELPGQPDDNYAYLTEDIDIDHLLIEQSSLILKNNNNSITNILYDTVNSAEDALTHDYFYVNSTYSINSELLQSNKIYQKTNENQYTFIDDVAEFYSADSFWGVNYEYAKAMASFTASHFINIGNIYTINEYGWSLFGTGLNYTSDILNYNIIGYVVDTLTNTVFNYDGISLNPTNIVIVNNMLEALNVGLNNPNDNATRYIATITPFNIDYNFTENQVYFHYNGIYIPIESHYPGFQYATSESDINNYGIDTFYYTQNEINISTPDTITFNEGEFWNYNSSTSQYTLLNVIDIFEYADFINNTDGSYLYVNNNFYLKTPYKQGQIIHYNTETSLWENYILTDGIRFITDSPVNLLVYNTVSNTSSVKTFKAYSLIEYFIPGKRGFGYNIGNCWLEKYVEYNKIYNYNSLLYTFNNINDLSDITEWVFSIDDPNVVWTLIDNGSYNIIQDNLDINTIYITNAALDAIDPETINNLNNYRRNHIYKFNCLDIVDYEADYSSLPVNVMIALQNAFNI